MECKGNTMNRKEAKEYIKANPEIYFRKAKKTGYVCPLCQSGSGRNGTGITEIPRHKGYYKCFVCQESGDVLHFIGKEYGLSDFKDILNKGIELYSIVIDGANYKKRNHKEHTRVSQTAKSKQEINDSQTKTNQDFPEKDYADFFKEAAKHMHETDYLTKRGISKELQKEFNIGYCKEWKHPEKPKMIPSERIIIPTSKHSYMARAITEMDKQYKAMKVGKSHIFNCEVLSA